MVLSVMAVRIRIMKNGRYIPKSRVLFLIFNRFLHLLLYNINILYYKIVNKMYTNRVRDKKIEDMLEDSLILFRKTFLKLSFVNVAQILA